MPYTYEYPRPALTTDIVVFTLRESRLNALLIQRREPPFAGISNNFIPTATLTGTRAGVWSQWPTSP
jgi:hypothetical protein